MGLFDATVKESIYDQLIKWGVSADVAGVLDGVAVLVYMVLWILLINLVFRWGVVRFVHWMVSRTKVIAFTSPERCTSALLEADSSKKSLAV